ncbi:group I truncated hemoglobin [Arenimonas alkanexedens]
MKTLLSITFALLLAAGPLAAQDLAISAEDQALLDEEARLDAAEAEAEGEMVANDPSAPNPAPAHPELRPVLEQFGGEAGLTALMETFMAGLLADPRTGPFFANSDQVRVKRQLTEQFCVILGGDCSYTGRDMRSSHRDMQVGRGEFNALVEVLQVAMNQHDVPFAAQNKLLAKLAPMHREIVTQ